MIFPEIENLFLTPVLSRSIFIPIFQERSTHTVNRYAMVYVYPWHVDANKENFVRESFAYNNPGIREE